MGPGQGHKCHISNEIKQTNSQNHTDFYDFNVSASTSRKQHITPEMYGMSMACVNIEGYMKFKYDDSFRSHVRKFDIFGMCETWASEEKDFDKVLPEYSHFDFICKRFYLINSGGVTVSVKNHIVETGMITRIFEHFEECVILLFNG